MKHFIVIDGGTQNIKAFIFNENGVEVLGKVHPVVPYFSTSPDFAEQDMEAYVAILKKITKELIEESGIDKKEFSGVAITTHRSTIVPVDMEGRAIRFAITWLDERKVKGLTLPGGIYSLMFLLTGMRYTLNEYQRRSKFNWLKVNDPENYKKTYKFLTTSSFIFHALTGEFKDCYSMIVGLFPIDLKRLQWHGMKVIYDIFGVERERLPDLVGPTEIAGYVGKSGSLEFGIPEGLPVFICAGDKQLELLGAGGIYEDIAEISYGTAAVIEIYTEKYITHPKMDFFTWGAGIPHKWTLEGFVGKGYWMVSWFLNEFCKHEMKVATDSGVAPEDLLDMELSKVPPGSMGLMLQPYWSPFVYDPKSRGAIIGFSSVHTRAHVYRAIVEGIGFELRRLKEVIESYSKKKVKEIRVGGGGSRSNDILQITADLFNLPVKRMHTENLAALGAAIDLTVGMGIYKDFEEAVHNMVREKDVFLPNPENVKIYDQLFRDVYLKIYPALSPLYHRVSDITGYPGG